MKEVSVTALRQGELTKAQIVADMDDAVNLYNETYHKVNLEGKSRIFYLSEVNDPDSGVVVRNWIQSGEKDFKELRANDGVVTVDIDSKGNKKEKSKAELWVSHANANRYERGVVFDPLGRVCGGALNLFTGWGVEPQDLPEQHSAVDFYLEFVFDVICARREEVFNYVMSYFAHMVQKPNEIPKTAILMKSIQGIGKGAFMSPMLRMIGGAHSKHLHSVEEITGQFNEGVANNVLIFADEFYASTDAVLNTLKMVITESSNRVNGKHKVPYSVRNYNRLVCATNESNALRLKPDDRRWFYIEPSSHRKGDTEFFNTLFGYVNDPDFAGCLMDWLLRYDIDNWVSTDIPQVKELVAKKAQGKNIELQWFEQVVRDKSFSRIGIEMSAIQELRISSLDMARDLKLFASETGLPMRGDVSRLVKSVIGDTIGVHIKPMKINGRSVRGAELPSSVALDKLLGFTKDCDEVPF